jgi:hypothetical protein
MDIRFSYKLMLEVWSVLLLLIDSEEALEEDDREDEK